MFKNVSFGDLRTANAMKVFAAERFAVFRESRGINDPTATHAQFTQNFTITTKMATSCKVATDSQKKQSNKDADRSSDEEDKDDLDLGTSAAPHVSIRSPTKDFEMINLDADEEDEEDEASQRSDDRRKKRYRKKKKKKEEITESSSEDESTRLTSKNDDINPVNNNY